MLNHYIDLYVVLAPIFFLLCLPFIIVSFRKQSAVPKPTAQDRAEAKTAVEALLDERMPK